MHDIASALFVGAGCLLLLPLAEGSARQPLASSTRRARSFSSREIRSMHLEGWQERGAEKEKQSKICPTVRVRLISSFDLRAAVF
ncbi:hypothetical protein, partial [Erythrobacter sp. YJ-T3-07]|uniref:hypothetical protein n=1 Tax=Erythrobacter sp. YJ-T3-07 TaxID=2793063 RepID=UPI001F19A13D